MISETFSFLVKAMSQKPTVEFSARGAEHFDDGDWCYTYEQSGTIEDFDGFEVIQFKDEIIFTHKIMGGLIINKS